MKFKIVQHENWQRSVKIEAENEAAALDKYHNGDFVEIFVDEEFDLADVTAVECEAIE